MGRSVSTPSNSIRICYRDTSSFGVDYYCQTCDKDIPQDTGKCSDCGAEAYYSDYTAKEDWDSLKEWIRETAADNWPSFVSCAGWLNNVCQTIAENDFAKIVISEYCGCTAVALVSRKEEYLNYGYPGDNSKANLCDNYCKQISEKFVALFGEYAKIGTASNGESFYQKVA